MFIVRVFTVHVYDSKSSKYCNFKELRILLSVFVNIFVVEFFQILHKYEERGIVFNEYRPYLWGKEARMYYNIHSNQERNLLNQPTTTQVLNSLDRSSLVYSCKTISTWIFFAPFFLDVQNSTYSNSKFRLNIRRPTLTLNFL